MARISKEKLEQYKQKIILVAKAFDSFCNEHDLRYFGIGGTAIGALRHGGIIPWDDDIDVIMPRPDYEHFLELAPKCLSKDFDVLNYRNTTGFPTSFSKICDANTTLIGDGRLRCVVGAFVDIFPLDGLPELATDEARREYFNSCVKERKVAEAVSRHYNFTDLSHAIYRRDFEMVGHVLKSHYYHLKKRKPPLFAKWEQRIKSVDYESANFVAYFGTFRGPKVVSPKEWFDSFYYVDFEDFKLRLPIGIDQYLTQVYGDYMTPPPENKRELLHSYYYLNLDKRVSYEEAMHDLMAARKR